MSRTSKRFPATKAGAIVYPFSAIVGQDEMKLALMLSVVDPILGGVLIMGHRGTGKSTAVRALAELLPQISIVSECVYRCDPADERSMCASCSARKASGEKISKTKANIAVIDLPLGATEDRICGSIDIERALKNATKAFEPGLLARANRGFLYIDEVNLLEDHLVDLLLDVAVTGRNLVEREGISIEHPARFVLVGSGNPEEGDLRPQLLDRFGLHVEITTENEPERRAEIVERREQFEADRELFAERFQSEQDQLRKKISRAQSLFASIKLERPLLMKISQLCAELKLDGHRGELTLTRAARAVAALAGRRKVVEADVKRVATICLRHRLRREPFEETGSSSRIDQAVHKVFDGERKRGSGGDHEGNSQPASISETRERIQQKRSKRGAAGFNESPGSMEELKLSPVTRDAGIELKLAQARNDPGRSSRSRDGHGKAKLNRDRGRYAISGRNRSSMVALDATLRAWASLQPPQRFYKSDNSDNSVPADALRFKQFKSKQGSLFVLAIDASGSMAAARISKAREVAYGLLKKSYLQRDSIAIIVFRGSTAELVLPPSRSMLRAKWALDNLTIGGGTPLSAGIALAIDTANRARQQHESAVLVIFTDGHANVLITPFAKDGRIERKLRIATELESLGRELQKSNLPAIVIDTQNKFVSSGGPRELAERLQAQFVQLH